MEPRPCAHCGEIVGMYEPAYMLLADRSETHGSLLILGELAQEPGNAVVHERCFEDFTAQRAGTAA